MRAIYTLGVLGLTALAAVPVLAVAPEAGAPPRGAEYAQAGARAPQPGGGGGFGMGPAFFGMEEDPELALLALDVYLLRGINEMQLTAAQVGQVLPALQHAVQARLQAREQTKRVLRQVREQLLRGESPPGDPLAQLQGVQQQAEQAGNRARQQLASVLNARQQQVLQRMLQAGMPGMPPPGREGPARMGGGMSPVVLERLAVVLQEKLRYLR